MVIVSKPEASELTAKVQVGIAPDWAVLEHETEPAEKKEAGLVAPAAERSHLGTLMSTWPPAVIAFINSIITLTIIYSFLTVNVADAATTCELLAIAVFDPSDAASGVNE